MPELPEVETIRRGLGKFILNKKIVHVDVLNAKSFLGDFQKISGFRILNINRRGKALIFELENDFCFLIHLRMTGQLIYVGRERFAGGHPNENFVANLPNKQTRVIFRFEDDSELFFNDQRKFGFVKVVSKNKLDEDEFIKKLGKEPWELSAEEFFESIYKKTCPIKAALLDQSLVAGLGNIYADESLFLAGIFPGIECWKLNIENVREILEGAKRSMGVSIEVGGSTIKNYVKADGTRGDYLDLFANVYGRDGKKCKMCGSIIKKIRIAGRGTHYCPLCQEVK